MGTGLTGNGPNWERSLGRGRSATGLLPASRHRRWRMRSPAKQTNKQTTATSATHRGRCSVAFAHLGVLLLQRCDRLLHTRLHPARNVASVVQPTCTSLNTASTPNAYEKIRTRSCACSRAHTPLREHMRAAEACLPARGPCRLPGRPPPQSGAAALSIGHAGDSRAHVASR